MHHPLKKEEKAGTWWPSMCSGQKLVLVSRAPWLARNRFWDINATSIEISALACALQPRAETRSPLWSII
ncbi:hypothetical protein N7449_000695 [Penicillium cf. viridicatum]|uniref:Uncharacterized protein n=1 Tax=Penicillium cf. viridicatum TaxID=2972119 RepID=A0A9W9N5J1_9EURO|nr:hypothetical protein N7449_000695 [Penicillium cf. viridicatum]